MKRPTTNKARRNEIIRRINRIRAYDASLSACLAACVAVLTAKGKSE